MLDQFGVKDCKVLSKPMAPHSTKLQIIENWRGLFFYREAIGALLFLTNLTRPDVAFAVNWLACWQTKPQELHWTMVCCIFQYLKGTSNYGLKYSVNSQAKMFGIFVDSDYRECVQTRKSTTSFLTHFYGNVIQWGSKLQTTVAECSGEAEYYAICEGTPSALFLIWLFQETLHENPFPVDMFEDATAAISHCTSLSSKGKLQHIELIQLKVKKYFQNGNAIKMHTHDQIVDCLTKPLPLCKFEPLCDSLVGHQ